MTPQQFAALAGTWIEIAVCAYAKREIRRERRARELELLNRHAGALNAEGDDSAAYQAPTWRANVALDD